MNWLLTMFRLASAIGPLVGNLGGVNAHAPATQPEMYQTAANAVLADPATQLFLTKLTPEKAAEFSKAMPTVLEFLDWKIEAV